MHFFKNIVLFPSIPNEEKFSYFFKRLWFLGFKVYDTRTHFGYLRTFLVNNVVCCLIKNSSAGVYTKALTLSRGVSWPLKTKRHNTGTPPTHARTPSTFNLSRGALVYSRRVSPPSTNGGWTQTALSCSTQTSCTTACRNVRVYCFIFSPLIYSRPHLMRLHSHLLRSKSSLTVIYSCTSHLFLSSILTSNYSPFWLRQATRTCLSLPSFLFRLVLSYSQPLSIHTLHKS